MPRSERKKVKRGNLPIAKATEQAVVALGRPSLYKPEYAQMLVDHFRKAVPIKMVTLKNGAEMWRYNDYPTFEEFAEKINVVRDTLHHWATVVDEKGKLLHPEFSDAYARAQDRQRHCAQVGIVSNGFAPSSHALVGKNVVGWKDESEVKVEQTHKFGPEHAKRLEEHYAKIYAKTMALNAKVGKAEYVAQFLPAPKVPVTIEQAKDGEQRVVEDDKPDGEGES